MSALVGAVSLRRSDRQHGVAVIEATIILPLLIFMMLAVAEIGRAISQYNTLSKSVRDAARYMADTRTEANGAPMTADFDARKTAACNLVMYGRPAASGAKLLPGLTCAAGNITVVGTNEVQVTVPYTFQAAVPIPTFGFAGDVNITEFQATASMRFLK